MAILESPHPYTNSLNQTWTHVEPGSPANIYVKFSNLTDVESGYDYLYLTDSADQWVGGQERFTGTALAGAWITVPGDTINVRLTSDNTVTAYGFAIDIITTVEPPPCDFSWVVAGNSVGTREVTFTDLSAQFGITGWAWDFDDGNTSTDPSPIHGYATGGDYNVSLTITFGGGSTATMSHLVTVTNPGLALITPAFTPLQNYVYEEITFSYTFDPIEETPIGQWWDFADGSTSPDLTPTHRFMSNGVYDVLLIAEFSDGSENIVHFNVTVLAAPAEPSTTYASDTLLFSTEGGGTPFDIITPSMLFSCPNVYLSTQFEAVGGVPPYAWSAVPGSLPSDLVINPDGLMYGEIMVGSGSYSFDITVTDSEATAITDPFTLYVKQTPTLVAEILPSVAENDAYSYTLTATNLSATPLFEVDTGTLPPGLTLDPVTGEISGTPTTAGSYTFTIKVTN